MFRVIWIIVLVMSLLMPVAFAENNDMDGIETSVLVNDDYLYSDTAHILVQDQVFIVGKYLVEGLGGTITWQPETKAVKIIYEDQTVLLTMNQKTAYVNGQAVALLRSPHIREGRIMLPLRFVSDLFDFQVVWDSDTLTVHLSKNDFELPLAYRMERSYTDEDLILLAKIVTVESGDKSLEMAMAIANTVLNRVKDGRFPNSIEAVIYQVDRYVQFPPAHKASFADLAPSRLSLIAAKKSLEGNNPIGNSLYFNNQPFSSKAEDLIRIIDGEYFYE